MNILLIGKIAGYETARLAEAAAGRGHALTAANWSDIRLHADAGAEIDGRGVADFDLLYVRRFWPHVSEVLLLARAFAAAGKPVVDAALLTEPFVMSKLGDLQTLAAAGIPVPRTVQCFSHADADAALAGFRFPVVVKGVYGRAGQRVFLAQDAGRIASILRSAPHAGFYTLQEYLPTDHDLRVITVGHRALGAMRRTIPHGDFRANIAVGGIADAVPLPDALARLAVQASTALGREFAGVDILVSDGKPYVLEVNRAPGFKGFESATGIDVAAAFLGHCERRLSGRKD